MKGKNTKYSEINFHFNLPFLKVSHQEIKGFRGRFIFISKSHKIVVESDKIIHSFIKYHFE